MKCITDGKVFIRVSDKEAEHYIKYEGWSYHQKKKDGIRYVCEKCGKKFFGKPSVCDGVTVKKYKGKDGEDVLKKIECKGKKFAEKTVQVPSWR